MLSGTAGGIDDGTPLSLYLIRLPTDDINHLSLFPEDSERVVDNSSYRIMLGQKGSDQASTSILFPPVKEDNKLQYERNISIRTHYDFSVFARLPQDMSDLTYRIEVKIELDHTRDGIYDDEIKFVLEGRADNNDPASPDNLVGDIDIETRKLGDLKAGRLRLTFSRLDDLDIPVWLYAGYLGYQCMIELPYSKFVYVPQEKEVRTDWTLFVICAVIVIVVVIGYVLYQMSKKQRKEAEKEQRKGKRRRGKR